MPKAFKTKSGNIEVPDTWNQSKIDAFMLEQGIKEYSPITPPTLLSKGLSLATGMPKEASAMSKTIEFLRPMIAPAAGLGGMLSGGPFGAVVAPVSLDIALQKAQGAERPRSFLEKQFNVPPESLTANLLSTGEMAGMNVLGGKVLGGLYKYGKAGLAAKLNTTPDLLESLGATASARMKSRVLKFFEDVFAGESKEAALEASTTLGKAAGLKKAAGYSGLDTEILKDPHETLKIIKEGFQQRRTPLQQKSTALGDAATAIASRQENTLAIPNLSNPKLPYVIKGPVDASEIIPWAESVIAEYPNINLIPDQKKSLYSSAIRVLAAAKAGDGKISFRDAWDLKQSADSLSGYSKKRVGDIGYKESKYGNLAQITDDAIQQSFAKYQVGGEEARRAYLSSKALAHQRMEYFDEGSVQQILDATGSNPEFVQKMIDDPEMLRKALVAGRVSIPGTGRVPAAPMKGILQGAKLKNILDNAYEVVNDSTTGQTYGRYNAARLVEQWSNPDIQKSLRMLYSQNERADIGHFLTALANVSQKQTTGGKIATYIRVGGNFLTVGSGLVSKGLEIFGATKGRELSSSAFTTGAIVSGITIPIHYVSKVLTNPRSARIFTSILEERPLNVSEHFAARMIFGALQGAQAELQMQDGTLVPGTIVKGGRFEPLKMPE